MISSIFGGTVLNLSQFIGLVFFQPKRKCIIGGKIRGGEGFTQADPLIPLPAVQRGIFNQPGNIACYQ
jgi:hypothetical protein